MFLRRKLMNIGEVFAIEKQNKKIVGKRARMSAAICVFALALMFAFQLLAAYLQSIIQSKTTVLENSSLSFLIDIFMYIFYIAVPFGIAALIFKAYHKNTSIFLPKRSAPKYAALYIIGAVGAGYVLNLLINLLFPSFVEFFSVEANITADNPLDIILCIIMVAVLPAVLEEWAFRGVLLKNLLPYGRTGAVVISSMLFGLAHLDPPRIIFATAFGLVLGMCYEYTGSLLISIIIHFINNSISVIVTLMPENSALLLIIGSLLFCFMGCGIAAVIVYSIKGIKKKSVTLNKQAHYGYTLSTGKYVSRMFLNFAFIPFILVYAFIFILSYFPQLFIGLL